jgi:hypothetical protein
MVKQTIVYRMQLLALCASHINHEKRLEDLYLMLNSWKEQTFSIELHISLSSELDILDAKHIQELLRNTYGNKLFVYPCSKRLSQFKHYERLTDFVLNDRTKDAWIIFTDDDDLSHSSWIEVYHKCLIFTNSVLHFMSHISIPTSIKGQAPSNVTNFTNLLNLPVISSGTDSNYTSLL